MFATAFTFSVVELSACASRPVWIHGLFPLVSSRMISPSVLSGATSTADETLVALSHVAPAEYSSSRHSSSAGVMALTMRLTHSAWSPFWRASLVLLYEAHSRVSPSPTMTVELAIPAVTTLILLRIETKFSPGQMQKACNASDRRGPVVKAGMSV